VTVSAGGGEMFVAPSVPPPPPHAVNVRINKDWVKVFFKNVGEIK